MFAIRSSFKPGPNDFIIVVMGPTGSGKTNFINSLTGNIASRSAGNLESDTQKVIPYRIPYRISHPRLQDHLVLVDTPGFDDTFRPDMEILRSIADWLIRKYPDGSTVRVAGVIYAHRITDPRMSGSAQKNLQLFGRLCGHIPLPRTRLVTTMWDLAKESVAEGRETELITDFWRPLIDGGAKACRFGNTPNSAREIVDDLLSGKRDSTSDSTSKNADDLLHGRGDELLLQEELVEQQKRLNETEAGKVLYNRLQNLLTEQKKTLKELVEEAKLQRDPALVKSLQEECEKVDSQLQRTFEEIKEMKIPLSRRIILWVFGRKSRARAIELGELQH